MRDIDPAWRTTTVQQMCQTIRLSQDYGILPILADALQDAGCEDPAVLDPLRNPALDAVDATRLVALVYSAETAASVRWVEQQAARLKPDGEYGEGVQPDYRFVMKAAREYIEHQKLTSQYGGMDWQYDFPADEFWGHYVNIVGREPVWGESPRWGGEHARGRFFSCSC